MISVLQQKYFCSVKDYVKIFVLHLEYFITTVNFSAFETISLSTIHSLSLNIPENVFYVEGKRASHNTDIRSRITQC
jgi:hypothetical protein